MMNEHMQRKHDFATTELARNQPVDRHDVCEGVVVVIVRD